MSQRCPSLIGTEHFTYGGNKSNPPSPIQKKHIKTVEACLGIMFNGTTSRQAYEFLGQHYEKAREIRDRQVGY